MSLPDKVRIFEVGPRDGLQNEKDVVPVEVKVGLIDRLTDAGLPVIEATSFVSPKWVPQLADAAEVLAQIQRGPGVAYPVLVPNRKGLDAAIAAGCEEIVIFGAATEAFSKRNTNCSIAEGLARFSEVCAVALQHGIRVRGDVSVCLGCPYEGDVSPDAVVRVARALDEMGCYEITICDTIGTGTAASTRAAIEAVAKHIPVERLAGHFHDTDGRALDNVDVALGHGLRTFDSAIGGLGGCPYAPGARGNVSTVPLARRLADGGWETGLDFAALARAEAFMAARIAAPSRERAVQ